MENLVIQLGRAAASYRDRIEINRNRDEWIARAERSQYARGPLGARGGSIDSVARELRFKEYGSLVRALALDLEAGMLIRVEQLIAADLFDGLLDQAEHLLGAGHHIPAAALGRVALDESLRQLAKLHLPADEQSGKVSQLIIALRTKADVYAKSKGDHIQGWMKTGDSAVHADMEDPPQAEVQGMLEDVREFVAEYLS